MRLTASEEELEQQASICIRNAIQLCRELYAGEYPPDRAAFCIPRLVRDHAVMELRKRIGWDMLHEGKACSIVDHLYIEGAEAFPLWCLWFDRNRSVGVPSYSISYRPIKGE